jgi:hypothetical protein
MILQTIWAYFNGLLLAISLNTVKLRAFKNIDMLQSIVLSLYAGFRQIVRI